MNDLLLAGSSEMWAIENVKPYPKNAKKHPASQIQALARQFKEHGFDQPLVVLADGTLIKGHGRLLAAKHAGFTAVPVIVRTNLTPAQARAARLADNKLAETDWDMELINEELADLAKLNFDVDLTGFEWVSAHTREGQTDEDDVPEIPQNRHGVERGQVFVLGRHRLMCGDSTSLENVRALTRDERIDMVYTDPPYGIDEQTDRVEHVKTFKKQGVAKKGSYAPILGDKDTSTAELAFLIADELASTVIYWGGNYYSLRPSPCWIVWDKREEEKHSDLNSDCELAWVKHPHKASVRIFRHLWKGMIKASERGSPRVHPTQKPVALAEWCFENYGKPTTVLDLFGGSGSTLIACESTGRSCFTMELDPHYCSVIIERWEQFTGQKAVLA